MSMVFVSEQSLLFRQRVKLIDAHAETCLNQLLKTGQWFCVKTIALRAEGSVEHPLYGVQIGIFIGVFPCGREVVEGSTFVAFV